MDSGECVDQVYLTVVAPFSRKGPHLHQVRAGRFICLKGNVEIVTRQEELYESQWSGEDHGYRTVRVPAGIPAEICNWEFEPAYVLNMPSPPWREDQSDECPVENWDPEKDKP